MVRLKLHLHDAQKEIIATRKRYNVVNCGRQWGKSRLGIGLIFETAWKGGLPTTWLSPTYPMLRQVFREMRRLGRGLISKVNVQEKRIEFYGGGSCDFWSADNYDSIRGNKYARAVMDEAAICRDLEATWTEAVRATLTMYKGDAYFLSTPKGNNYFKALYDILDDNHISYTYPTKTNPYVPDGEVEAAKAGLPPEVYAQEYEARFITDIGKVFKRAIVVNELPKHLKYYIGADLAYTAKTTADYTAVVVVGVDLGDNAYIVYVDKWQAEIGETITRLQAIQDEYQASIVVESNGVQKAVADMLRDAGVDITRTYPTQDKLSRSLPSAIRWNTGKVFVLNASWTLGYTNVIEGFTGKQGEEDDLTDATVHALHDAYNYASFIV